MKGTRVASRYAKALLDLALEQNVLDQVNGDMAELANLSKESKDLQNLFASPIIDGKKKTEIFRLLFDKKMNKMSVEFIALITKNNREGIMPAIADSFVEQFKILKGIVDVYITTATPLETATREKILAKVKTMVEGDLVTHEAVDPTLVGGFTVQINDKLLDASIASQFRNLKNILLN